MSEAKSYVKYSKEYPRRYPRRYPRLYAEQQPIPDPVSLQPFGNPLATLWAEYSECLESVRKP